MKRAILLSILLFAAFALSGCSYNELTAQQQQVKGKWANVEKAMQRRADLIPNLVETAKMAGVQEQEVFGQIADARSRLLNASKAAPTGADGDKSPEQKQAVIDANNSFGGTIGRLLELAGTISGLEIDRGFYEGSGRTGRNRKSDQHCEDGLQRYGHEIQHYPQFVPDCADCQPAWI